MRLIAAISFLTVLVVGCSAQSNQYPKVWFALIDDPNKPAWEILPQEAKPGEVILSKRNELGICRILRRRRLRSMGRVTRASRVFGR